MDALSLQQLLSAHEDSKTWTNPPVTVDVCPNIESAETEPCDISSTIGKRVGKRGPFAADAKKLYLPPDYSGDNHPFIKEKLNPFIASAFAKAGVEVVSQGHEQGKHIKCICARGRYYADKTGKVRTGVLYYIIVHNIIKHYVTLCDTALVQCCTMLCDILPVWCIFSLDHLVCCFVWDSLVTTHW